MRCRWRFWAVVINTVFGVGISILLVRYEFPGKRVLSALIDVPLSVSPDRGRPRAAAGLQRPGRLVRTRASRRPPDAPIIFDTPGMIMATCFVALPLVIREVVPVLYEIGDDQEQAARSLGAGGSRRSGGSRCPASSGAVVYGVVLSLARSLGEFGAVKIVSGNITGRTQTATLVVEAKYQNFQQETAYATSFLLIFVSIACLIVVAFLRPKHSP